MKFPFQYLVPQELVQDVPENIVIHSEEFDTDLALSVFESQNDLQMLN